MIGTHQPAGTAAHPSGAGGVRIHPKLLRVLTKIGAIHPNHHVLPGPPMRSCGNPLLDEVLSEDGAGFSLGGGTYWITGLTGACKTPFCFGAVVSALRMGGACVWLDGEAQPGIPLGRYERDDGSKLWLHALQSEPCRRKATNRLLWRLAEALSPAKRGVPTMLVIDSLTTPLLHSKQRNGASDLIAFLERVRSCLPTTTILLVAPDRGVHGSDTLPQPIGSVGVHLATTGRFPAWPFQVPDWRAGRRDERDVRGTELVFTTRFGHRTATFWPRLGLDATPDLVNRLIDIDARRPATQRFVVRDSQSGWSLRSFRNQDGRLFPVVHLTARSEHELVRLVASDPALREFVYRLVKCTMLRAEHQRPRPHHSR